MDDVVVLGISSARHSCKVCGKGFPCGRSLGGHMRSHSLAEVAMAAADADDYEEESSARGACNDSGYGLRANPKKTCGKLLYAADDGEHDEAAEAEAPPEGEEAEEDRVLVPTEASVLMPAPRRRRRSMRVPAPAPPPAARDAFDTEPEDVALCLIMLSRDTPSPPPPEYGKKKKNKRRIGGYHHHHSHSHHEADYSDDASAFFHQYDDDDDDVEVTTVRTSKRRKPAAACLGGRYECPGCGRAFQSYQALGGHRASHKRINSNCRVVALEQPEPSVETNASSFSAASPEVDRAVARKMMSSNSKFECPICFKVFASGQALGGHKRSHSITAIVEPEQTLVAARFLDLNLPAPGAED